MCPEGALLPKGRVLSTKASLSLLYMNHHPPTPPHSPTSPHQVKMQVIFWPETCFKVFWMANHKQNIRKDQNPLSFLTIGTFLHHTKIRLARKGYHLPICAIFNFSSLKMLNLESHIHTPLTKCSLAGFHCNYCSSASSPRTGWIRPLPPPCTGLPHPCSCPCPCTCLPCPCSSGLS